MIDKDRTYRTRDGREVRIYATDGRGEFQIHGAIKTDIGWSCSEWKLNGQSYVNRSGPNDLIEVRPRHKRTVWLTVWSFNYIQVMSTPEWQISKSGRSGEIPYACIKVELDYEEGEGL